jgi:hypothetical protein
VQTAEEKQEDSSEEQRGAEKDQEFGEVCHESVGTGAKAPFHSSDFTRR